VYSSNLATVQSVNGVKPLLGDHTMVNIVVEFNRQDPTTYLHGTGSIAIRNSLLSAFKSREYFFTINFKNVIVLAK
jgi:hypothetical protein